MKIKKLHHIGIAVKNIQEVLALYKNILGFEEKDTIDSCSFNLKLMILQKEDITIELMEQIDDSGVIAKFIEKRGEGIHHIAFEVENLDKAISELEEKGIKLIKEKSYSSSRRNVFIHPKSLHGVLIELCEIK